MKYTKDELRTGIRLLRQKAEEARTNAGFIGAHSDYGASRMEELADSVSGLMSLIPDDSEIPESSIPDEILECMEENLIDSKIELKYIDFFGTGEWEEQYKMHIVEFAKQCLEEFKDKT